MNTKKLVKIASAARSVMEVLEPRQLLSGTVTLVNPDSLPSSDRLIFSTIQNLNTTIPNVVHDSQPLTIENTGASQLTITSLAVSGPFELVNPPTTPIIVSAGQPLTLTIEFTQNSEPAHSINETNYTSDPNGGAAITGSLTINSSDTVTPSKVVTLAGYWQYKSENNNEPSLATISGLLAGYDTQISYPGQTNSGNPDLPNGTSPEYYGQEVYSASWAAADPSAPVTITQLAAYHTQGNVVHTYWYSAATEASHLLLTSQANQGQTLLPTLASGGLMTSSFTPNGAFGLRVDDEYSDDAINTASGNAAGTGHHFRFYPLVDEHGNLVPNTWLVAMDYAVIQTENFDFNDNVFIVSNITPNDAPSSPTNLTATNGAQPVLNWTAVTYSAGLQGYNVYRAINPAGPYTKLTASAFDTTTTYTDITAPAGSTLYYQVTAVSTAAAPNESAPATTTANTPAGIFAANYTISAFSGQKTTINVLANDTDGDGTIDPTTLSSGSAGHGTTALDPNAGVIDYTSNSGFTGTDTFTYTVHDDNGNSGTGTVTVNVEGTTTASPVANPDSAVTLENAPVTINVLANDEPVTTFNLSTVVIGSTSAARGITTLNSDGTITYSPDENEVGQDTFSYTVTDANGQISNQSTVTVNVGVEISSTKGANHSIVFTNDGGTKATVTLNRGTADVYFSGIGLASTNSKTGRVTIGLPSSGLGISGIALSNTTVASSLQIHAPGNVGSIALGGITDSGIVGSIVAPVAQLTGTIDTNTVNLGGVRSISLKGIQTSQIVIGGQLAGTTSLNATNAVTDSDFSSSMAVHLLKAASWTNPSHNVLAVSAPAISVLSIAGEFDPDVSVTGLVSSAHIAGPLAFGVWNVGGNVSSLYAASSTNTWGGITATGKISSMTIHSSLSADVTAATLNALTVNGSLSADITAGTAKLIHVTGALTDSAITLSTGGSTLGTLLVGGQITDSTVSAAGNIAAIIAGSLSGDTITAGNDQTLANVTSGNIGTASINTIVLTSHTGFEFADTTVIAAKILNAALKTVNTDNSGTPQGLALGTLHSITFTENGDNQHLNSKSTGVTAGDFEIVNVSI